MSAQTSEITRPSKPAKRSRLKGSGSVEYARKPVYGILAIIILIGAFPLYWSFVIASTSTTYVSQRLPHLVPGGNLFANVEKVFQRVDFWNAAFNSVLISSAITASVLFFATLAGYSFAKLRFRGSGALFAFIMLTMAVPPQLGVVGLYKLMSNWGWIGNPAAVIVPGLVSAFGVFFMRNYLRGVIPTELLEAARVDGAGQFRTFLTVAVPAARPALAILGLFTFVGVWTDFFWPLLVFQGSKANTLQTALAQLQASLGNSVDHSLVLTGVLMSTVPLLILFFVAGKQLVAGIMAGAVKS